MDCVVNGPGEAREADYGVAGGNGIGIIFKKGEIVKKVDEKDIINELKNIIRDGIKKQPIKLNNGIEYSNIIL